MNKQIEALKMAIEFIERHVEADEYDWLIQACKEALAEAEKQEPVAEVIEDKLADWSKPHVAVKWNKVDFKIGTKFYTHPAPSWQSLSDDEIQSILDNSVYCEVDAKPFARAIEQALKELNEKK